MIDIHPTAIIGPNILFCENVTIRQYATVAGYNTIGNNVDIYQYANIGRHTTIEDDVFFVMRSSTLNTRRIVHGRKHVSKPEPVVIKRGARIGACVTILPGVTIGEECFVGAGSLVTKDTKPYSVYYGNPSRYICPVPEEERLREENRHC